MEELAALEGHLPNSAWAIRRLLSGERQAQHRKYRRAADKAGPKGPPAETPADAAIHDEDTRHDNIPYQTPWPITHNKQIGRHGEKGFGGRV